jgi:hypothetical protein
MPSALVTTDELNQFATTANQKMRRNFDPTQLLEIRVAVVVKGIGEKLFDGVATELSWGQADGVQHQQIG